MSALTLPASAAPHSGSRAAMGLGEQLLHLFTQHYAPELPGALIAALLLAGRDHALPKP